LSPDSIATTAPSDSLSAARHFPGAPVIDKPAPDPRRTRAEEGLSSSRDTLLPVPRPLRRRVPRRPLQVPKRLPWPSPNPHRLGTLSSPPKREPSRRCRLRYTLRTEQLLHPASTPASRPDPGASLPGTLASPRTGLTPAGCRELDARLRHDYSFRVTRPGCWTHVGSRTGRWRRLPRASPRPSNRACGSPAHGSPTPFTVRHSQPGSGPSLGVGGFRGRPARTRCIGPSS
jgi:hypothetical protein